MTPLPLPLFAPAPSAAATGPVARPGPAPGSVVRVEGLEGSWRVRRAGDGWVEVVGEDYRTVAAGRVQQGEGRGPRSVA